MFPLPTSVFLTKGIGIHRHQLTSFEFALRDADIEQQNLVSISSILPPRCKLIPREEGVATLQPGEITFSVLARALGIEVEVFTENHAAEAWLEEVTGNSDTGETPLPR